MVIMNMGKFYSLNTVVNSTKIPVQSRFTRYLTQVLPSAHGQHMELSSETLSSWNKHGIAKLLLLKSRPNIDERRERDVLHIFLCRALKPKLNSLRELNG